MHFLPDVYVTCDVCNGHRYNEETLRIKYKSHTIADLLSMTVDDASAVFSSVPQSVREAADASNRWDWDTSP